MIAWFKKRECPYCFAKFTLREAPFRCVSEESVCVHARDERFAKAYPLASSADLGQVIHQSLPFKRVTCGLCQQKTRQRICPSCHADLPLFLSNSFIAVIGPKEVGKTAYLETLIKDLLWQSAADFEVTLRPLPSPPLKNHYVFHLIAPHHEALLILKEIHSIQDEKLYLKAAKGFICLMDVLKTGSQEEFEPATVEVMAEYIEELTPLFKEQKIKTPTAFVLTRLDLLKGVFPKTSLLMQATGEAHFGKYMNGAGLDLSHEVKGYLEAWFGRNFLKRLHYLFSRRRFFAVSAKEAPLKVVEPFLWFLKGWGFFKKREENLLSKCYKKVFNKLKSFFP